MRTTRFILVDDDELNNTICKLYIKRALPDMEIVDFTLPEQGFQYVETAYSFGVAAPSILLLDINMPVMNGWDFLAKYAWLDKKNGSTVNLMDIG